jgi:RNA polymerase sigma-70 factor (ECF subfamily)
MTTDTSSTGFDLSRLIQRHQTAIWRYLRVLGCDAAEAEDLTQETFLAVFQHPFEDYNPAATARYLRTTARNLLLAVRRRTAQPVSVANIEELDAAWTRWVGDSGGEELLVALESCLGGLADRARRALELRFRDKKSREEIAAALDLSPDGAKNLLQRTKHKLRECIERKRRADE